MGLFLRFRLSYLCAPGRHSITAVFSGVGLDAHGEAVALRSSSPSPLGHDSKPALEVLGQVEGVAHHACRRRKRPPDVGQGCLLLQGYCHLVAVMDDYSR